MQRYLPLPCTHPEGSKALHPWGLQVAQGDSIRQGQEAGGYHEAGVPPADPCEHLRECCYNANKSHLPQSAKRERRSGWLQGLQSESAFVLR